MFNSKIGPKTTVWLLYFLLGLSRHSSLTSVYKSQDKVSAFAFMLLYLGKMGLR